MLASIGTGLILLYLEESVHVCVGSPCDRLTRDARGMLLLTLISFPCLTTLEQLVVCSFLRGCFHLLASRSHTFYSKELSCSLQKCVVSRLTLLYFYFCFLYFICMLSFLFFFLFCFMSLYLIFKLFRMR